MSLPFLHPLDVSSKLHPAPRLLHSDMLEDSTTKETSPVKGMPGMWTEDEQPIDASNHSNDSQKRIESPSKGTPKSRSFSDSTPHLSPSPRLKEKSQTLLRDDHTFMASPRTPRRTDLLTKGLSLQMPPRTVSPSPSSATSRVPLSPQLDTINTYGSPATVLPRHSRGLDFARACTNLHHSTLAEQSTPDSSPTISQKGMAIPFSRSRSHRNSMSLDSPSAQIMGWGNHGADRTAVSSSLGSINMLASDSSSSDSEDDDSMGPDDNEDTIMNTPQVLKLQNPSTTPGATASPGGWPPQNGAHSFLNFQRARLRKGRSRHSSSSASVQSGMASPGPTSPPQTKNHDNGGGYFAREVAMRNASSRRESLSMPTNELHISSGNESGDEASRAAAGVPSVVRRPVTRRGNLLPKTRAFGRIRAELFEEIAPVDSEAKREAEIIRQVRESDDKVDRTPTSTTGNSSPNLPAVPGLETPLEGIPEDFAMNVDNGTKSTNKGLFGAFGLPPPKFNKPFNLDTSMPQPNFIPRGSSSGNSDDISMDSPSVTTPSTTFNGNPQSNSREQSKDSSGSRSSTPHAPPSAAEGLRKSNKRRRDDDFDINSIKRRAVSPGMSVQNSPILSQSPHRDWGTPRPGREGSIGGHASGERSNSGGSLPNLTPSLAPKRIGLQGMTDTNDGLMKMSIE